MRTPTIEVAGVPIEETEYAGLLPPQFTHIRDEQLRLADQIHEMFVDQKKQVVILQAPVGTGKTLLAEMVRLKLGVRELYLPPYLMLQDQQIRDFGGEPTLAKLLKGRSNYPHGGQTGRDDFKKGITCADCRKRNLCKGAPCAYTIAKVNFCRANVGVANSAYFLAAANYMKMFRPGEPPAKYPAWYGHYLTVIDECDTLEQTMLGFLDVEITMKKLAEICNYINKSVPAPPVNKHCLWPGWHYDVKEILDEAVDVARENVNENSMEEIRELVNLEKLAMSWSQVDYDWQYVPHRRPCKDGKRLTQTWKVSLQPIQVGEMGKRLFWDKVGIALPMSGSVVSAESWAKETGLDKTDINWGYVEEGSKWDHHRRPVMQVPGIEVVKKFRKLPWSKQPCWARLTEKVAWVLEKYPDERTIVHTFSHDLARELGGAMKERLIDPTRVVINTGDSKRERDQSVRDYLAELGRAIFSASLARGFDCPDDKCRNIIVAKVPWMNLGDRRIAARRGTPDGWEWFMVKAIRELLQMTGRAMRHRLDWCRIWIMDSTVERIMKMHNMLPGYWVKSALKPGDYYIKNFKMVA